MENACRTEADRGDEEEIFSGDKDTANLFHPLRQAWNERWPESSYAIIDVNIVALQKTDYALLMTQTRRKFNLPIKSKDRVGLRRMTCDTVCWMSAELYVYVKEEISNTTLIYGWWPTTNNVTDDRCVKRRTMLIYRTRLIKHTPRLIKYAGIPQKREPDRPVEEGSCRTQFW